MAQPEWMKRDLQMLSDTTADSNASTVALPFSSEQEPATPASVAEVPPGVAKQPAPAPSRHPSVWILMQEDFRARVTEGVHRYGVPLTPHNGRDALTDAYQETLDLAMYLRQLLYERDAK